MSKKDKIIYSNVFYQWAFTPKHNVNFTLLHWSAAWHYFFVAILHQRATHFVKCFATANYILCSEYWLADFAGHLEYATERQRTAVCVAPSHATPSSAKCQYLRLPHERCGKRSTVHWLVQLFIKNMTESEVILSAFFLFYIPHCF